MVVGEHVVVALQICLVGVGLQICVAAVAVEEHAKGRRRAVEEHAEDARQICIATVVAEEHTEGLVAAEEHTEDLAAAEMDDSAGGGACGGGREEGVFFLFGCGLWQVMVGLVFGFVVNQRVEREDVWLHVDHKSEYEDRRLLSCLSLG